MFKFTIFKTSLGYMGLVGSSSGLHMVILPKKNEKEVIRQIQEHYSEELLRDDEHFKQLIKQLSNYYSGEKIDFKVKFDVLGATPFEIKVWDTVFGIPYGEVRSYDWVARKIGAPKKVRSVGQALKRNRLPLIIPCHRVVSKTQGLGGFSAGVELKRKLLQIEGRIW